MAIRERLNSSLDLDLDLGIDDLDRAYIEQMVEAGMDESLIQQFIDMAKAKNQNQENSES